MQNKMPREIKYRKIHVKFCTTFYDCEIFSVQGIRKINKAKEYYGMQNQQNENILRQTETKNWNINKLMQCLRIPTTT